MSLNKFTDTTIKDWMKIGCQELACQQLDMPNGTCINAYDMCVQNELKVDGITDIAGNNYATPDLGQPAFSLHTDGLGSTYWDVDSAGSGDISYNGVPPTIPGQLVKFSGVDGKTAEQSSILDSDLLLKNGAVAMTGDLDLGNHEIKNCTRLNCDNVDEKTLDNGVNVDGVLLKDGLVDNVDVASFKTDYDSKVNQEVKNTSSPTFASCILEDDLTLRKAGNTGFAVGVDCFKSRGTLASPTAVLVGDRLSQIATYAHDGTSYADVAFIRTQATENHTPGAKGTKMEFYTTSGINPVLAFTLEPDGRATLGTGDNRYLLPNSSGGVADGAVLAFNVATKDMEFKDKWNYTTQFGGNVNTVGDYFVPLADPNFATNSTLDNTKEIIVPVDSYLDRLTYSTTTGDATSSLQIVVDGLNPLQFTFTLGGAQGVLNIARQPNRLLTAGTRVAIKMNGGTVAGSSNLTCVFRS